MVDKTDNFNVEPPVADINIKKAETTNVDNPLDKVEQSLRIEELKLKVRELNKSEYKKISTWTGLVAIFVAVSGVITQGVLYEIKSVKAQNELDSALRKKDLANLEVRQLSQKRDSLGMEVRRLDSIFARNTRNIEKISDELDNAQLGSNVALKVLREDVNATAIDLRSSSPSSRVRTVARKPLNTVIEELFSAKASVRGAAYNDLMTNYAESPQLVPSLLSYASGHKDNQNGIYNTLVVLGHLDYSKVPADVEDIRAFAAQVTDNGPKTADRIEKLLRRLPR
ncbi:hypothetical protein L3C95_18365 [Chitinophaga filiformis]|uniref:hypothetical protein n=1 Tax=Chitinophaga filiformis TaxID=104663 RepID=UPI001F39C31B|nr:hypothetical protein [Chitinophaga filiformis]MCF6404870.1 hypothetical protein [Chitinophaga filiformis]